MTDMTIPDYAKGATMEDVWAALRDVAERQKETDRLQKENEKKREESEKQWEETKKQMKETDRRIGEMCNRFGELAEHLVAPGIAEKFDALGYHFDTILPGGLELRDENGKGIAEVDILLQSKDCILAVEVKTRPRINDIDHHIKRLKILRNHRSYRNDRRKIIGAIAGAVFGNVEKKATAEAGFYVLEQSGDTMKIDIPQGFIPREW